jgi:hypothetical protein
MMALGLAALLAAPAVLAGEFTIKHPNGYVHKGQKVYWDDHVIDGTTHARVPYPGLVLHSEGEFNIGITLFIMGYKGPGKYPITGTQDIYTDANRSSNVFYSNMGLLVVDPANSAGSFVEVTEDAGGLISGTYRADVAYPIGKDPRMTLSGTFTKVEKNQP